jgi:hypothetical protein
MFNNLFKLFAKDRPAEFSWAIAAKGEKRLREVKEDLSSLRKDYANGNFAGHPEEMLEAIEDFEKLERILTKAKRRGWTPDAKVIKEIEYDIQKQTEYMMSQSYSQTEIDSEIACRQEDLKEALIGLR